MSQSDVFGILMHALTLTVELSAPVLVVGIVAGVLVSLFQAVTQINDSTLALVPKIAAVFVTLAVCGPWMFHQMGQFAVQMLTRWPGSTP